MLLNFKGCFVNQFRRKTSNELFVIYIFQKQHNVVIWNARLVDLSYTLITFLAIYVSYMYMHDLVSYDICSLHWTWVWVELKSSLPKLYGGHHAMINSYGISVSEMTRICPNCRNHNLALSSLMSYHRVCYKSNTTTATSGTGTTSFRNTWFHLRFFMGFVLLNFWFSV